MAAGVTDRLWEIGISLAWLRNGGAAMNVGIAILIGAVLIAGGVALSGRLEM